MKIIIFLVIAFFSSEAATQTFKGPPYLADNAIAFQLAPQSEPTINAAAQSFLASDAYEYSLSGCPSTYCRPNNIQIAVVPTSYTFAAANISIIDPGFFAPQHTNDPLTVGEQIPIYYSSYYYDAGRNMGSPCDCAGDPINLGTGNEYRDETDASLVDLSLHRYYNSHPAVSSSHIGAQWRDNFDRSLEILYGSTGTWPAATVVAFRADGRQITFSAGGGGTSGWTGPPDVADTLTEQTDDSGNVTGWLYLDASTRNIESYDTNGNFTAFKTPDGQTTTLVYSTSATPASIAPEAGLLITVTVLSSIQN